MLKNKYLLIFHRIIKQKHSILTTITALNIELIILVDFLYQGQF